MLNFLKDNFDYKQSYAYELLREADAKIAEIYKVYDSQEIQQLWKKGQIEFGSVTLDSAGYVARYAESKPDLTNSERLPFRKKTMTNL